MRTIPIQATRSVKISDLAEQYKDHAVVKATKLQNPKATEIVIGLPEGSTAEIAETIEEAVETDGRVETYETWAAQKVTKIQNAAILKYVNDNFIAPEKKKGSEILRLPLSVSPIGTVPVKK